MFININNNDSYRRNTTCAFIYIQKEKEIVKRLYKNKNPDTFQKERLFIHKNQDTLSYAIFIKKLKLAWIYIQKAGHFSLRDVFVCTKIQTLRKKKDNLRYVYLYIKIPTLCVTQFFIGFLKLAEGGGDLMNKKQCTL